MLADDDGFGMSPAAKVRGSQADNAAGNEASPAAKQASAKKAPGSGRKAAKGGCAVVPSDGAEALRLVADAHLLHLLSAIVILIVVAEV